MRERPPPVAVHALAPSERSGGTERPWCVPLDDPIALDLRDKVVAAGLALGTVLLLEMLGLGRALALALVAMAPAFTLRPVRRRLFPAGRETFEAYYVAWLYGPLGWGLYKGVRWAQVLGVAVLLAVVLRVR
jgi:hypothetical protein